MEREGSVSWGMAESRSRLTILTGTKSSSSVLDGTRGRGRGSGVSGEETC